MRQTSLLRLLAIALAGLFVTNRASATTYALDANLDPFQEVPPHNTPGYGSADLTLDDSAATLTINASTGIYADLLAGATTVRLQDAAVGASGPTIGTFNLDTPRATLRELSAVRWAHSPPAKSATSSPVTPI